MLHSVLPPEGFALPSMSSKDVSFKDTGIQRLFAKEPYIQEELGELVVTDSHTAISLLRTVERLER